jgi:hypothetical protein
MLVRAYVNICSLFLRDIEWRFGSTANRKMAERESELRMALRHVKTGQGCIVRQQNVVATLRRKGLPTEQAEAVLVWLEDTQREFEQHYRQALSDAIGALAAFPNPFPPP